MLRGNPTGPAPPVVALSGRLDGAAAPELRRRLRRLTESGATRLVLDLSGVSFIDSAGLGAVLSGLRLAREAGGDLRIAGAGPQVRTVLELTALDGVLRPHGSVEEALAGFEHAETEVATAAGDDAAAQLDAVHGALERFWRRLPDPPGDDWRMRFELAVSEVAANIVEQARPATFRLRLRAAAGCLVADFTDAGEPWAGRRRRGAGDAAEPVEPGAWLAVARSALDEVAYERRGATNHWRLVKRL